MRRRSRPKDRTVAGIVAAFRESPRYAAWSPATRDAMDRIFADFGRKNGDKLLDAYTRGSIRRALDAIHTRRGYGAATHWLRAMRALFGYALDLEWIRIDPTAAVTPPRATQPGGLRTWREDEIDAYLGAHPIGTTPHLAMTLMLYTGSARADVVTFGWGHVHDGRLLYRRQKVRGGPMATIRILPPLEAALAHVPRERVTFLETAHGRQRTPKGLGNAMRLWIAAADLDAPDGQGRRLGPHGLRKAMGRRLAEAGATPHEIMAVLGHQTIKEAARYSAAYNRTLAADAGLDRLGDGASNVVRLRPKSAGNQ